MRLAVPLLVLFAAPVAQAQPPGDVPPDAQVQPPGDVPPDAQPPGDVPPDAQPPGDVASEAEELARIEAAPTLDAYYAALAEERLLAEETGSVRRLRAQVRRGEALYFAQRFEEAAQVLYEVVRSPRFRDFEDLEDVAGAELLLAVDGLLVGLQCTLPHRGRRRSHRSRPRRTQTCPPLRRWRL